MRFIRSVLRDLLPERTRRVLRSLQIDPVQYFRPYLSRHCPYCDYRGRLLSFGAPLRWDAQCPSCGCLERDRLAVIFLRDDPDGTWPGKSILHFAPERALRAQLEGRPEYYTADLNRTDVDYNYDITQIDCPTAAFDVVIANHVLEHVPDDAAAMRELFRILRPGGVALLSVPIADGYTTTYENPAITSPFLRKVHFLLEDHQRFYGADFADRISTAGFDVRVFQLDPPSEIEFGIGRGEKLFVCKKPL